MKHKTCVKCSAYNRYILAYICICIVYESDDIHEWTRHNNLIEFLNIHIDVCYFRCGTSFSCALSSLHSSNDCNGIWREYSRQSDSIVQFRTRSAQLPSRDEPISVSHRFNEHMNRNRYTHANRALAEKKKKTFRQTCRIMCIYMYRPDSVP